MDEVALIRIRTVGTDTATVLLNSERRYDGFDPVPVHPGVEHCFTFKVGTP